MKESDLGKSPTVTPFSSGSEGMNWLGNNCDLCARNTAQNAEMSVSISLVNKGKHCPWEVHLGYCFVVGELQGRAAKRIGWTDVDGMPAQCIRFKGRDEGGPGRRSPKPVAPNQLVMPIGFGDLFTEKIKIKNDK